jgi:extradiol dioxygenase family protein
MFKFLTSLVLAIGSLSAVGSDRPSFHLALVTNHLDESLDFYAQIFQRKTVKLDDKNGFIDFYGTVLAFTEDVNFSIPRTSTVIEEEIPEIRATHFVKSMHFGTPGLTYEEFFVLVERLKSRGTFFVIEPTWVNKGTDTEQIFTFVLDPQGYILELRSLKKSFELEQIREYAQQEKEHQKSALEEKS